MSSMAQSVTWVMPTLVSMRRMDHLLGILFCALCLADLAVTAPVGGRSVFSGMLLAKRQNHASEYHTSPVGRYAEAMYRSSRQRSDELRKRTEGLDSLTHTSLRGGSSERVWDLFYPDYNCPLVKERLGGIGGSCTTCMPLAA